VSSMHVSVRLLILCVRVCVRVCVCVCVCVCVSVDRYRRSIELMAGRFGVSSMYVSVHVCISLSLFHCLRV